MASKKKPAKKAKLRPDANEIAHRVMLEATGQAPKTPPPSERTEKNPDAVKRGSKGGKKGGKARAARLGADERKAIAQKAAASRWSNVPEKAQDQ